MAEVLRIVSSALLIGDCAVRLSSDLFIVARTFKHAAKEIADIAEEIFLLSDSLQSLADIIENHHTLCKPELFKNTERILARYKQVDAEIKKLIDTPQKLARLKWCINKPKATSLLKKVEGIKTLLILELNLIRVAREEVVRSGSDEKATAKASNSSVSNRFRKIVEGAVQANRQVVESAQRADTDNSTWERGQIGKELDIWRESSLDTATWLYHLVFNPQVPCPTPFPATAQQPLGRYQASVSDANVDDAWDDSPSPSEYKSAPKPEHAVGTERAMIVWNGQTEPSSVVDRLLYTWTTLTAQQINRSSVRHSEDDVEKMFFNMVHAAKEEQDAEISKYNERQKYASSESSEEESKDVEEESSSNVAPSSAPPPASPQVHTRMNTESSAKNGHSTAHPDSDFRDDEKHGISSGSRDPAKRLALARPSSLRRVRWRGEDMSPERPSHSCSHDSSRSAESSRLSQVYTIDSHMDDYPSHATGDGFRTASDRRSDVHRGYVDSQGFTYLSEFPSPTGPSAPSHRPTRSVSPNPFGSLHRPKSPNRSDPANRFDSSNRSDSFDRFDSSNRYNPYNRFEPPEYSDAHGESLREKIFMDLKTSFREDIVSALERILAVSEGKNSKTEPDDYRLSKIMELLVSQQEHHVKLEKAQAEAAAELNLQQIAAARDSHENTIKRLESLILQQREDQARIEAEWKAEREVLTEKLVTQDKAAQAEKAREEADVRDEKERKKGGPQAMRRTCIKDGSRSFEVAEYGSDRLEPLISLPTSPSQLFEEGMFGMNPTSESDDSGRRYDSFINSATSWSAKGSRESPPRGTKKILVLPSKTDKSSPKTLKLQASLAASGIEAVFDDTSNDRDSSIRSIRTNMPRSSIFWESPTLSLSSELLCTMKRAGWKPMYVRSSDAGQTFFLGDQPIHSYIFQPEYQPQYTATSTPSSDCFVVINQALVEQSAMDQLGFRFQRDKTGAYMLDGRLTVDDIEDLIERSFSIRETRFRRLHRQLQWHQDSNLHGIKTPTVQVLAPSEKPLSPRYATNISPPCSTSKFHRRSATTASSASSRVEVERSDSDDEETPSLMRDSISTASPSVASLVSKSTNPYRQHMLNTKGTSEFGGSIHGLGESIWDDPALH